MDSLSSGLDQHAGAAVIVLSIALIALAVWTALLWGRCRRLEYRFEDMFGGLSSDNTARMLTEYLGTVRSTAVAVNRMRDEHDRIASLMPTVVRHVGLVRFSPFHDTGGDQSFALALLDGNGDGVVITGLHSRTDSRLYAKPIERGASSYTLTPEEREAMERAFNQRAAAAAHT